MTGELERELLRLEELAERCEVRIEVVERLVTVGVVEPEPGDPPLFGAEATVRIRRALRLRRQLGVSVQDIALVLELLERIDVLEARLARLLGGP